MVIFYTFEFQKKSKVSSIKKSNQLHTKLSKQGKLKKRRNKRKLPLNIGETKKIVQWDGSEEEEETNSSLHYDDIKYFKNSVIENKSQFVNRNLNRFVVSTYFPFSASNAPLVSCQDNIIFKYFCLLSGFEP